ncbi:conserved hypothetical protein [uncultured Desulfobacterium sp.]|uniref:Uncharacterized protein n=1 Tax=uncultured Desulfobacterium sp. TaxID=201089 RepID=A0A445MWF8_9BACT|nr:conserved hypothetical protein [uncultured Desulfobacterium sp.]
MNRSTERLPITKAQIKMIKSIQGKNLDDVEYREILEKHFRVTSCTQLSQMQAGRLIDMFAEWGFFVPKRRVKSVGKVKEVKRVEKVKRVEIVEGKVVRLASREQHEKIAALASLITWRVEDGLYLWMEKRMGFSRVRTAQEAYLAIEGLKKMFENQMKAKYGTDWWARAYEDDAIMRYIEEHK